MKTIKRKSLIYKTEVEYGDYTVNHVLGCAHGCKYPCYAYLMAKRFGKVTNYEEWIQPAIVENALEILELEIPKYRDKIHMLHLCFTTDPFMYGYPQVIDLSLKMLKKLNDNEIICSTLTKGIVPLALSELSKNNEYGITVISLNEEFREVMEPGSAPIQNRIEALKQLHNNGCKTWVSIEPYPTPNIIEQDLEAILNEIDFVDKIIFGRMNYNKAISEYKNYKSFFNECANFVIEYCKKKSISYYIKKGTLTEID